MSYPEKIYANSLIGSNGINCLDYRESEEDVEYIRADKVIDFIKDYKPDSRESLFVCPTSTNI